MPLIKKDKASEYRDAIVDKRSKSKRHGAVPEEKKVRKRHEAVVETEEAPQGWQHNKAILLFGLIPIGIAIMFAVRGWPKNADKDQRHLSVCCHNLRSIHYIKKRVAEEVPLSDGEDLPESVADAIVRRRMNLCPAGERIAIGLIGDEPRCSIHGVLSDYEGTLGATGVPP